MRTNSATLRIEGKNAHVKALICIGTSLMRALYALMKLRPVKPGRILFLSRQSDTLSTDFQLLQDEIAALCPQAEIRAICCRQASSSGLGRFALATLKSMALLATSQVCVLDAYWPAVSLLSHKPQLTVIQMWHSLGKIKQSGLASVGKRDGRSASTASLLHMHEGYDYVIAGAPAFNPFYCQSFGCDESRIRNTGLPRLDLLTSRKPQVRKEALGRHPELADKPVVVYAPTFRRGCEGQIIPQQRQLIEGLAASPDFTLVIREHPNQPLTPHLADLQDSFITCPDLSTLQILSVADLVITDYSAVLIEAASARVPFLLYCFDFDTYTQNNGLNLNLRQLFNDLYAEDPQRIFEAVEGFLRGSYPTEEFEAFVSTYTLPDPGHATRDLAALAIGNTSLKGACDPCAM